MKITVTPMGDVVIDTDDVEAAISFVNTLRNGSLDVPYTGPLEDTNFALAELPEEFQARKAKYLAAQPKKTLLDLAHVPPETLAEYTPPKPKRARKPRRKNQRKPLPQTPSAVLGDTLNWLVTRGSDGATPARTAAEFGITNALASYRLRRLVRQGMVERVGRGRYLVTA